MRPTSSRAGTTLVLVLVLLAALLVAGLGHGRYASSVTSAARRATAGEHALAVARNALELTHHLVSRSLNDPGAGGPLYGAVRGQPEGFSFGLPVGEFPALREQLAEDPGLAIEGGVVRCDVSPQFPASGVMPTHYDRLGTMRLVVSVSHAGLGVMRRLAETYELRVALTTTPRPFDLATFFVGDPTELLSRNALEGDPNRTIGEALGRQTQLCQFVTQLRADYEQLRSVLAPIADPRAQTAMGFVVQGLTLLDELPASLPVPLTLVEGGGQGGPSSISYFPSTPFSLCCVEPAVALADLDVSTRVGALLEQVAELSAAYNQANADLRGFFETRPADISPLPSLTQAWCTSVAACANGWAAVAREYQQLQACCVVVADESYQRLLPFMAALDPADLAGRAQLCVTEADGALVAEQLDRLLGRGEALNGVVFVDNPTQPLVVDRSFAGHLVLVVRGDVTVTRALVDEPGRDRLTVVAFGHLDLQGPVQGSVVAWGTLTSDPAVSIDGNLVLRTVTWAGASPDRVMVGNVTRGAGVAAGPDAADGTVATVDPTRQTVLLAPYGVLAESARL